MDKTGLDDDDSPLMMNPPSSSSSLCALVSTFTPWRLTERQFSVGLGHGTMTIWEELIDDEAIVTKLKRRVLILSMQCNSS
jgi:hypothetical protein